MQPTNTYATRKNFKTKFENTFPYTLEDNITKKSAVTYIVLVLLLFQIGKYSTNSHTALSNFIFQTKIHPIVNIEKKEQF